jgi:hypothetical protein
MVERFSMLRPLLALALVLVGCSDTAESCGFEGSSFLLSFTRLNGDCPTPEVALATPGGSPPRECRESIKYEEGCKVQMSRGCALANGDQVTFLYRLAPSSRGFEGSAQFTLLSPEPNVSCASLYLASFVEQ